jgi:hypothetical protein
MTNTTEETMDYTKAIAYLTTLVSMRPSSCFQRGGGFTEAELQDPAVYSKALDVVKMELGNVKTLEEIKRRAYDQGYDAGCDDYTTECCCGECW